MGRSIRHEVRGLQFLFSQRFQSLELQRRKSSNPWKIFIFAITLILSGSIEVFAQQNVFHRSDAGTGNWWDGANPWYYATWNNNQDRPDRWEFNVRNTVAIGHNNNTTMSVNGAFFGIGSLTFQSGASSARTLNASGSPSGIGLTGGITNDSVGSHTFNVPIGLDASTVNIFANSGHLTFTSDFYLNANTAAFSAANSITVTVGGVISGGGGMTKSGAGALTLSGPNTYTGKTILNAGRLAVSDEQHLGANPNSSTADQLTLNGGTFNATGSFTIDDANRGITINTATTLDVDGGVTLTIARPIAGSAALNKIDSGLLVLAADNSSFGGNITVASGGTIRGEHSNAFGNTTGITTIFNGGALTLTGTINTPEAITARGTGISSAGAIRNAQDNNTISGKVTIDTFDTRINSSAGTLTLDVAAGNALEAAMNVTLGGGGNITINDPITVASGKTVTKDGAGTLTMAGNSTFNVGTTVSAGTLLVSGSIANSAVALNGGAVAGAGTIGALTMAAGTTVSPGNTASLAGTLSVNGAASLQGIYTCDITGTGNTQCDLISASAAVSASAALTINLPASAPSGFNSANSYSWTIMSGSSASAANMSIGTKWTAPGDFAVSASGNNIVITYSAPVVPAITVEAGTLVFGSQVVNTSGSQQQYTVSGINLSANIVITAPSGLEVSTTSGSGFGPSVTLTHSGGNVNETVIYARFTPNNVSSFSGDITHTSTGATTQNKAVTGTGTAPNDPAAFGATGGSLQSVLTFTLNAQSKPVVIVFDTDNTFTTPSGAPPSVGQAFAGGTVVYNGSTSPQTHSSLNAGTLYYYKAFTYDNVNGHFYSAGLSASALTIPAAPTVTDETSHSFLGFTANWAAATGADSYRLDVSSAANFSAMVSGYNNLTVNGTSQAVTVPNSGLYYYRVRAVNTSGTSGNSSTQNARTSRPEGVNGGGSAPAATVVAPIGLYVGDTGTFAVKTWGDVEGNYAKWRVVVDTDNNIFVGGIRGAWTDNFSNSEYKSQTSPRFVSAGTWYWGMQMDYGEPYGINFWMVRNSPDWTPLLFQGTNVNLTVTVQALGNPTAVSAVKDGTLPSGIINLGWTRWNSKPAIVVRSTGAIGTPANGTAYAVSESIPGGGTVVYNGSGTSFADTGLNFSTTYNYKFYTDNNSYYSAGATASETTDALPAIPPAPVATAASGLGYTNFFANWNTSAGATSYRLDVSRNAAFTDLALDNVDVGNITTYEAAPVGGVGHYFYRVRAVNIGGTSDNSNVIELGTLTAQARNTAGAASPQISPSTIYVGDTATYGLNSDATLPPNNFGRIRVWVHSTAHVTDGTAGNWSAFMNTVGRTVTRQMTSAGTFYYAIQAGYGAPYGTNFWYTKSSASYYAMHYNPTGVTLQVTVNALGDPTGVGAVKDGTFPSERIDLAWTRWNSRNVMIVRSLDNVFTDPTPGQVYTAGNTIGGDIVVYNGSDSSFEDSGLSGNTTYYYRFYTENFGYYATGVDASETTNASLEPDAPVATAASSPTISGFTANWNASAGANSYRLDVSSNGTFTAMHPSFNDLNVGNVTTYVVSGLPVGPYFYRVRAVNGGGTSDNSNVIETGTTTGDSRNKNGVSPPYYRNLSSVDQGVIYVGDTITVGADLWGQVNGQNGTPRAVIHTTTTLSGGSYGGWGSADSVDYTEAVTPKFTSSGTWYWGIQMSYGSAGTNFWHVKNDNNWTPQYYAGTNATIAVTVTALGEPTGPSATANGENQIDLAWTKWNNRNVMIVRSTDNTFGAPTANTTYTVGQTISGDTVVYNSSGTSFSDTGLGAGNTYYYKFYSENYGYYSAGTVVNATTAGTTPDSPTAYAATTVGTTSFQANWSVSSGATGYRLDVSTDIGFGSFVGSYNNLNVNNVTAYSVSGLTGGQTYHYRVRASNGSGTSESSGTITVVTPATATVVIQSIVSTGPTSGDLNFTATVGATYDVYYSDNDGSTWIPLASVTAQNATETVAVTEDGNRQFKVAIAGANVVSSPSTPHAVIEKPVPSGYSMLSAPVAYGNLSLSGTFGDELKTGLSNGSRLYFMEANGSMTTITLSGGNWSPNYTPVAGQGFFLENVGGSFTPRFAGPVGNTGSATITLNGDSSGRWNIIGLSQGKTRTFAQTFPNGNSAVYNGNPPTANWNQNSADVIAIDIGGGVFRRVFRAGNGNWLDASTLAAPSFTFPPGAAVYYQRRGGNMDISF